MLNITISAHNLSISTPQPYNPGDPITPEIAQYLNTQFTNKITRQIEKLIENFVPLNNDGTQPKPNFAEFPESAKSVICTKADKLISEFSLLSTARAPKITDPIQSHELKIALGIIDSQLKISGEKLSLPEKRQKALNYINSHPEVTEAAKRRVKQQEELLAATDGLEI